MFTTTTSPSMLIESFERIGVRGSWRGLATVISLLFRCLPSTIIRRIWAIVINSSKSEPVGAISHRLEERSEGVQPLITDRNASSSIGGVSPIVLVRTPLLHCCPSFITSGMAFAMRQPVFIANFCGTVFGVVFSGSSINSSRHINSVPHSLKYTYTESEGA